MLQTRELDECFRPIKQNQGRARRSAASPLFLGGPTFSSSPPPKKKTTCFVKNPLRIPAVNFLQINVKKCTFECGFKLTNSSLVLIYPARGKFEVNKPDGSSLEKTDYSGNDGLEASTHFFGPLNEQQRDLPGGGDSSGCFTSWKRSSGRP